MKQITKISTLNMSRAAWLEQRRKTIGGSDAAAIIGLNPWESAYSVWADKLGMLPEKEETESMRLGRDLEDYVAKRFSEATGKKVRRENSMIYNALYPFAHADIDRAIVGEYAGLECKTTSALNVKRFKNGEYPENYYVQCVHYLAVTGWQKWYIAVLVLGEGLHVYEINRDEDEIKALMESEASFWNYVTSQTPPAADGTESTAKAISAVYPVSDDEAEADLTSCEDELREYVALSAQIKSLTALKDAAANKIKAAMGDAGKGDSDRFHVTFKSASRKNFDAGRYEAEHPELDLGKYYKTSEYRTLKVTEITYAFTTGE